MINLRQAVECWNTDQFEGLIKSEIESRGVEDLPLQQALQNSSYALDEDLKATLINAYETDKFIIVKIGLFYSGVIAGCQCADNPSPVDTQTEYCEIELSISKDNGNTEIRLLNN